MICKRCNLGGSMEQIFPGQRWHMAESEEELKRQKRQVQGPNFKWRQGSSHFNFKPSYMYKRNYALQNWFCSCLWLTDVLTDACRLEFQALAIEHVVCIFQIKHNTGDTLLLGLHRLSLQEKTTANSALFKVYQSKRTPVRYKPELLKLSVWLGWFILVNKLHQKISLHQGESPLVI